VSGKDLLGQAGARTRHAEDEDRPRLLETVGALSGDELGRIHGPDPLPVRLLPGTVEDRVASLERVGLAQHLEGALVVADLIVEVVECETGHGALRGRGTSIPGLPLQRPFRLGIEAPDHRQSMIGLGRILADLQNLLQFGLGPVEVANAAQDVCACQPGFGDIGACGKRPVGIGDGALVLAGEMQNLGCHGIAGMRDLTCGLQALEQLQRFLRVGDLHRHHGEVELGVDMTWLQLQHPAVDVARRAGAAEVVENQRHHVQDLCVVRRLGSGLLEPRQRLFGLALDIQRLAQRERRIGVFRVDGDCLAKQAHGALQRVLLARHLAKVEPGVGITGIQLEGFLQQALGSLHVAELAIDHGGFDQ
jgi:hypothetical protein